MDLTLSVYTISLRIAFFSFSQGGGELLVVFMVRGCPPYMWYYGLINEYLSESPWGAGLDPLPDKES
jgi:hypothetical protein